MKRAIYPGTFDPITHGHTDLIQRASKLFDEVVVAIACSKTKTPLLPIDTRIELAKHVLHDCDNVSVIQFDNLLVDVAKAHDIQIIVRGLRAVTDFEYEYQLVGMNRKLDPNLETVFLPTSDKYAYVSASLVREIASLGGDVTPFVAPEVAACLSLRKR